MANSKRLELLLIILVPSSNCNECPAGALRLVSCFSVVMFAVLHRILRCNYYAIISYKVFQIALTLALLYMSARPKREPLDNFKPTCRMSVQCSTSGWVPYPPARLLMGFVTNPNTAQ